MSIAFVASAEYNASSSSTATISVPTGTLDGHIMFAIIQSGLATVSMTPPGGSTRTLLGTSNPASQQYYRLYYRVANSEPASYAWTLSGNARLRGIIATYDADFDIADPIDVVSNTDYMNVDTILRATSMNVSVADSPLIFVGGCYSTSSRAFAKPSVPTTGRAEDYDVYNATPDMANTFCSMMRSGSGATGNIDGTINSSSVTSKHAFAVALNPPSTVNSGFFAFL